MSNFRSDPQADPFEAQRAIFRGKSFKQKLHRAEAVLGFTAAWMIFLGLMLIGPLMILWYAIYGRPPLHWGWAVLLGVVFTVLIVLEHRLARIYGAALHLPDEPVAITIAIIMSQGRLRFFRALWFAAHVIFIPLTSQFITREFRVSHSMAENVLTAAVMSCVFFMFAHAAHTYLLATIVSLTRSSRLAFWAWRWRFAIDLLQILLLWWLIR